MAVFGIGCNYKDAGSKLVEFYSKDMACMGYDPKRYPYFAGLFKEIQHGDIIFLKSLDMRRKKLKIKAIGIATNPKFEDKKLLGFGINVDWKKYNPQSIAEIDVSSDGGWHPRTTTIFKEYNENIINKIKQLLK